MVVLFSKPSGHIFIQSISCLMQYYCNNVHDLHALSLSMLLAVKNL